MTYFTCYFCNKKIPKKYILLNNVKAINENQCICEDCSKAGKKTSDISVDNSVKNNQQSNFFDKIHFPRLVR